MKRLVLCVLLVAATMTLLWFLVTFEIDDWRHPSGPSGKVQVHYTIAEKGPRGTESASFSFWIAGHVETVQFVPISYATDGFVALYIKTTEGWYESPRATVAPIDWKRGVEVHFHYPKDMVLRQQTRSPVHGFYPAFGPFRWRSSPFGFGDHLDEGDIASVHFCNAEWTEVTVTRTNGLKHGGGQSWPHPGMAVEVTVSEE